MKIIEDKQNPLLKRREVKIIIEADKNPTMQESAKIIAEQFKTAEENIAVKQIKGKFGRNTFLITAKIYQSKETREQTEPKPKAKKKKQGVEKPAEQAEKSKEEKKPAEEQAKEEKKNSEEKQEKETEKKEIKPESEESKE